MPCSAVLASGLTIVVISSVNGSFGGDGDRQACLVDDVGRGLQLLAVERDIDQLEKFAVELERRLGGLAFDFGIPRSTSFEVTRVCVGSRDDVEIDRVDQEFRRPVVSEKYRLGSL